MTHSILNSIYQHQRQISDSDARTPVHDPEMLLIGCVDARLNIKNDIGIPDGKALIFRNVAALVAGKKEGEDPEHLSEAAVLEFAVNVMKVKDIVVMGHTDCGGIGACLDDAHEAGTEHVHMYLGPLEEARAEVVAKGGNARQQARAMEQAAVRKSVENLMTYEAVADAVRAGRLRVHGWVINTATKRIEEMNPESKRFAPIAE